MGLLLPPMPLTKKEFIKAWKEGKRTLQELDPKLWKWAGKTAQQKYKLSSKGTKWN